MDTTEKLIDDFLTQVDLVGQASPDVQRQIAELLRSKRKVLLASTGRRRTLETDQRDVEIYEAYMALRKTGSKVKDIEMTLADRYSRTPERIKSIVQTWKSLIG